MESEYIGKFIIKMGEKMIMKKGLKKWMGVSL
jgi:hypothetical protein